MADVELDVRGLLCPLPILRLKEAIRKMEGGGVIKVVSDDPAIELDLKAFCADTRHQVLRIRVWNRQYEAYIRIEKASRKRLARDPLTG